MVYGHQPFTGRIVESKETKGKQKQEEDESKQVDNLKENIKSINFKCKDSVSSELISLIKRILVLEPEKRPSVSKILKDHWFDNINTKIQIYNDVEREYITNEFIYNEALTKGNFAQDDKQRTKILEEAMDDNKLDSKDFINNNLESTEDPLKGNISSKSDIMAPFNTSCSDIEELRKEMEESELQIETKKNQILKFSHRVTYINNEYQNNFNELRDNGVFNILKDEDTNASNRKKRTKKVEKTESSEVSHDKKMSDLKSRITNEEQKYSHLFEEKFHIDQAIVQQVVKFGFEHKYIKECLANNENNHCTATYYLLSKDQKTIK